MKEICILPRHFFEDTMKQNKVNDNNVIEYKESCFISINDIGKKSYFSKNNDNVLRLFFHDISIEDNDEYNKCITENDIKQLIEFIVRNKDSNFVIHCEAGISRSGAIGLFINDYFNVMNKKEFKKINFNIHPNKYIYNELVKYYKK